MPRRSRSASPEPAAPPAGATVPAASRRAVAGMLLATFLLSAVLLFARLGHYALWADEAASALGARSVLQCGDTRAEVGHNLYVYRQGLVLNGFRNEGDPPFNAYLAAPFLKLLGDDAWGARFPFALFGLGTVALLLWWIWKWRAPALTAGVFCLGLLCNVSFFLYARQCHYYAPALFFFTAIAYLYLQGEGNRRKLALLSVCAALLMSAIYSFYIALAACIAADYLLWRRKTWRLAWADWAILIIPSLAVGLVLLAWWNPFHTPLADRLGHDTLAERLRLFLWHWRDMAHCEMIVPPLMLLAPWAAFTAKTPWLKRGLLAFFLYLVAQTVISTQTISTTSVSDVRYFCGLLPLSLALSVFTLLELARRTPRPAWVALPAAALFFGTNLFNGGPWIIQGLRSTPAAFVSELLHPPQDPFTAASDWLRHNAPEGATLWVAPNDMTAPIQFHAPHVVCGWLFPPSKRPDYSTLPPIFFEKAEAPDYVLVFGPRFAEALQILDDLPGVAYEPAALLDVYWRDLYRPELFWRTFKPVRNFRAEYDGIHLLRKIALPPPLKMD